MRVLVVEPTASDRGDAARAALAAAGHRPTELSVEPVEPDSTRTIHCVRSSEALAAALAPGDVRHVVLVEPLRLPASLGHEARRLGCSVAAVGDPPAARADLADGPGRDPGAGTGPGPVPSLAPDGRLRAALIAGLVGAPLAAEDLPRWLDVRAPDGPAGAPIDDDLLAAVEHLCADHRRVAAWAADLDSHAADLAAGPSLRTAINGLRRRARRILRKLR